MVGRGPRPGGPASEARERVLLAAERLFAERGFAAVTMRDIADALGIRQPSLYHHAPGGKEELFMEVSERGLQRHREGLARALAGTEGDLRAQLCAVAGWFLAHPPLDVSRLFKSDLPLIGEVPAHRLLKAAYGAVLEPIEDVLRAAQARGEVRAVDLTLMAVSLVTVFGALPDMQRYKNTPTAALVDEAVDLFVRGLR